MNENHTNQQGLTLEEIAVHKQALKIAIAEQQKNVNEAYRQVVAPYSESNICTQACAIVPSAGVP